MHIALTGVSGFIGSVIARHLHDAGHKVTGLIRKTSRRDHIEPWVDRFVIGNQDDESCWRKLLKKADCVIHNSLDWQCLTGKFDLEKHLKTNLMGSIRLLHAAAPRQFIYLSTIAVHHDMRPRWEGKIDEDHPLRPGNLYGACKAAIEAHLWSAHYTSGQSTCAIRPCAVYGIDPRLSRSIGFPIVRSIREGSPFKREGGGKFVHVDDVAALITACVGNPEAAGKAFNMADCYLRWADGAKMIAEILGIEAKIDFSSPEKPKNVFTKDACAALGVPLDRGHEGIRQYLTELIRVMQEQDS